MEAYESALQTFARFLAIGPTLKTQLDSIMGQKFFLSLPMDAASEAIRLGDIKRAVELLDQGRSLLWSEMGRFRVPTVELAGSYPDLASRFEKVCFDLRSVSEAEIRYETLSTSAGKHLMLFETDSD